MAAATANSTAHNARPDPGHHAYRGRGRRGPAHAEPNEQPQNRETAQRQPNPRQTRGAKTRGHSSHINLSIELTGAQTGGQLAPKQLARHNPVLAPAAAGETKLLRDTTGNPLSTKTGTNAGSTLITDGLHADINATANPTTGNLDASTTYDPWGSATATTGALPLGYQGGWTDPDTTQTNAHARWYNPSTATFTSRDTWTLDPDPTAQTNSYLYGNVNPQ